MKIFISIIIPLLLFADIADEDMDGVDDANDLCPNTPITDIVNDKGCSVERVSIPVEHHFDLSFGLAYTNVDKNTSQNYKIINFNYYYGDSWRLSLYSSTYRLQNDKSGSADSSLDLSYNYYRDNIIFEYTLGLYLPTYNSSENEIDYYIRGSFIYSFDYIDSTFTYQHTIMNDIQTVDTDLATVSLGKHYGDLYTTIAYTVESSIYREMDYLEDATVSFYYKINDIIYIYADITKGLNSSSIDQALSLSIGYSY